MRLERIDWLAAGGRGPLRLNRIRLQQILAQGLAIEACHRTDRLDAESFSAETVRPPERDLQLRALDASKVQVQSPAIDCRFTW